MFGNGGQVFEYLVSLFFDGARYQLARCRVNGKLARSKQKSVGGNGLGIGSDGFGALSVAMICLVMVVTSPFFDSGSRGSTCAATSEMICAIHSQSDMSKVSGILMSHMPANMRSVLGNSADCQNISSCCMQWAADKYGMPKPGSSDDSDLPLIMDELYARATGKIVLANLGLDDLDHYFYRWTQ